MWRRGGEVGVEEWVAVRREIERMETRLAGLLWVRWKMLVLVVDRKFGQREGGRRKGRWERLALRRESSAVWLRNDTRGLE